MLKKALLTFVFVLLSASLVFAAGPFKDGVSNDTIKVGAFLAKSGPVAGIGLNVEKGYLAAINNINKKGGVHGRKIEVVFADDGFNPAKTTVEVKRMVESDNVFAIYGLGTPGILAVMDYLNEKGVPFVGPSGGGNKLSNPPKKYVFPFQPNNLLESNVWATYLVERKKAKRIAIVYRNVEDGIDSFNGLTNSLKKYNQTLVAAIPVKPTDTDFSTILPTLIAAKPDAIVFHLFIPQSSNFVKQAKQFGLKDVTYLTNYANPDPVYVKLAGDASDGVEATAWAVANIFDVNDPFTKIFRETYPNEMPTAYAAGGFVAAELLILGLQKAGKDLTRESFVAAMESLNKVSAVVANEVTYKKLDVNDPTCRFGKNSMYVLKVRKGQFVAPPGQTAENMWIYYKK